VFAVLAIDAGSRMTEHRDPLSFDFGVDFKSSSERVPFEREARIVNADRALPYHHAFLDDYLRCIMPNDLILIGAATGAGKTELARSIAATTAVSGKHVHYFALEAEPFEIERRTKFAVLAGLVIRRGVQIPNGLNYADWYCGRIERYLGGLDDEADAIVTERFKTLHTYYRGSKFDHDDIRRLFLAINSQTDLIVLDHLHYVDIDDENENRGFKRTMKMIHAVALGMGKPVILVVHLRKRDQQRRRELVPTIDDVHGSSDIGKICTRAIILAPAYKSALEDLPVREGQSPTFFAIPKDRVSGACSTIALIDFDWRARNYADSYVLGRPGRTGDKFEPIGFSEIPKWATKCRAPQSQAPSHWQGD
jgi:hypothetical protein